MYIKRPYQDEHDQYTHNNYVHEINKSNIRRLCLLNVMFKDEWSKLFINNVNTYTIL